ncbi:hypothetical protein L2E82_05532 [Cichorium intybus]|uniref:Uncharacterized protein n=1 Tax=Cichorium intybus TaxID=13427 RepID=A0ACB9H8N2_CICIN|nr:hypothetical protein L2E82_05532 [Cichorium intybus]
MRWMSEDECGGGGGGVKQLAAAIASYGGRAVVVVAGLIGEDEGQVKSDRERGKKVSDGRRCPVAAKLVLVTKSHLFKPTLPASKERMIGKQANFFHQGDYHFKLRRLVLRAFTPESIKHMVSDIESNTCSLAVVVIV